MVIKMRYLFFFTLIFFSSFAFANQPHLGNFCDRPSVCASFAAELNAKPNLNEYMGACTGPNPNYVCGPIYLRCISPQINDPSNPEKCVCPAGQAEYNLDPSGSPKTCGPICIAPQISNIVTSGGVTTVSCIDKPDESPPSECPSGYPEVNGQCAVCPGGHNPDGSCNDPTQCGEGETKQGDVNGVAVCAGSCSDPNQSWGFVNGVEGCYGAPSCPNGGSYGTVNGVSGCYGSNSSNGSNTSSGSGASAGSNTSSGSGTGGGSNTSSGSGSGGGNNGGNNGGGNNGGGGSGGSGGGSNNDIGAPYPVDVPCEDNFEKVGAHCVSAGQGDCITGYHELIVSRDPFLFICVANDTPPPQIPASSQSSASSQPNSSSPSSMQTSSSLNSGVATGSSGSNTSSGSGSGSGGSGGEGEGAGDCDPTSTEYLTCIAGENNTQIKDIKLGAYTADMPARLQQAKDKYNQKIQNIKTQFQDQMSVNIASGSGGLPSNQITLYGQSFEAGIAARSDFFELIRWAFFAAASILSLYILLSR